jgi:hypothetical protein
MERLIMLKEEAREVREAKEATKDTPLPPCFCVCRGNKGVTGEWLVSRGNKGLTREVASGGWLVARRRRESEVVGRSEMVQERRPLSIAGEA